MIIKFNDFEVRSRGCVMMKIDSLEWDSICNIIDEEDVYQPDEDHGITHNPHVTVLYGLYSFVEPQMVKDTICEFESPVIKFGEVGIFENPEFDVVKIAITSNDLMNMNVKLRELPHEDTFPDYKPHVTIGFVKKGTGSKYINKPIALPQEEYVLKNTIYSMTDGTKIEIEL